MKIVIAQYKFGGKKMKIKEMVICALFAALMTIGANVSPMLMIGGVPITLQLLFAILAGGLLGKRLGSIAMIVYLCLGLVGAPVFAQFKGGITSLLSPTFGYVISFIFVAYIVGVFFESQKRSLIRYFGVGFIAIFLNYLIGTNYMYFAYTFWGEVPEGFSYIVAWSWMAAYLPLDIGVTVLSLVMIPRLERALGGYAFIKQEDVIR